MPNLRTLAFIAGGVGAGIFVLGVVLALILTPGDCDGNVRCEGDFYDDLLPQLMILWVLGLVLVIVGAGILVKLNLDQRKVDRVAAQKAPAPRPTVQQGKARLPPTPAKPGTAGQAGTFGVARPGNPAQRPVPRKAQPPTKK